MRSERGASAVEYALLLALIAVAIILTVQLLGMQINELLASVVCFVGPPAPIC